MPLAAQAIVLGARLPTFAEQLCSPSASVVARAAYNIARGRHTRHRAQLTKCLQTWAMRNDAAAEVVRLHLLDALVTLDAKLPAVDLVPHLHGLTEVPACVLLVREARQNERELLAVFAAPLPEGQQFHSVSWWAAGNALCAQRAPGFAAVLLAQLECRMVVDVYLPGDGHGVRCGGGLYVGLGDEPRQRLPGFPPVPVYRFATGDDAQARVFAPGQDPVAWNCVSSSGDYCAGTSSHNLDRLLIAGWLRALAPTIHSWGVAYEEVIYLDAASYVAEMQGVRARFVRSQRDLRGQLVVGGHLTRAEAAAAAIRDTVEVCDCRSERHGALPEVPSEPVVEVRLGGRSGDRGRPGR